MLKPLPKQINGFVVIKDLGRLLPTATSKSKERYCLALCPSCKKEKRYRIADLKSGKSTKCKRCANIISKTTHGLSRARIYKIWNGMIKRCVNEKYKHFKNYGGKGIAVCDEWKNDFMVFYSWSIENGYNEKLSIDRINNDGSYTPNNCRWATKAIQSRNTRRIYKHNTSGYRGVYYRATTERWQASVSIDNKNIHLGYHNTPLEAAIARDSYVIENKLEHTLNGVIP